jgi:hypothetical protein
LFKEPQECGIDIIDLLAKVLEGRGFVCHAFALCGSVRLVSAYACRSPSLRCLWWIYSLLSRVRTGRNPVSPTF